MLDEAERGENAALRAYREALAVRELPADVRSVIARQAARIEEAHDCLRDLTRAAERRSGGFFGRGDERRRGATLEGDVMLFAKALEAAGATRTAR